MLTVGRLALLLLLVVGLNTWTVGAANAATQVYLVRGLMDLSAGLDTLAAKLKRRGIAARVASYTDEAGVTASAVHNFKTGTGCPVVLIGHSLGADAVVQTAKTLQQSGIPVALLVAFSPANSSTVPGNVARAINYYQSNSAWNNVYSRSPSFHGSLRNVDLAKLESVDHFNIEKIARIHADIIRMVEGLSAGCDASGIKPKHVSAAKP